MKTEGSANFLAGRPKPRSLLYLTEVLVAHTRTFSHLIDHIRPQLQSISSREPGAPDGILVVLIRLFAVSGPIDTQSSRQWPSKTLFRRADILGRNVPQAEISLRGSGSDGKIPLGRQPKQRYTEYPVSSTIRHQTRLPTKGGNDG